MNAIRSVAILGSGVMGSRLAAHFAGCGCDVLLLDQAVEGKTPEERSGLAARNLAALARAKPPALFAAGDERRIRAGNFDDHIGDLRRSDLVLEAVVEQAGPKIALFARVQEVLGEGAILASNTSGIPIRELARALRPDVASRFLGLHFFNPPRHLRLVEVISHAGTDAAVAARASRFLEERCGKTPVPCADEPAFLANRLGVHALCRTLAIARAEELTVEETDALTGPLLGRPRTATFRLADLVGLDTLLHIARGLSAAFPEEGFAVDPDLEALVAAGRLGDKTQSGWYRKGEAGLEVWQNGGYRAAEKVHWPELALVEAKEDPVDRLRALCAARGRAPALARRILCETLRYAVETGVRLTPNPAHVDEALELGFGWSLGPLRIRDALGQERLSSLFVEAGFEPPAGDGAQPFYRPAQPHPGEPGSDGAEEVRVPDGWKPAPRRGLRLAAWRRAPHWKRADTTLHDLGGGVLCLEFTTKMNAIGPGVLAAIPEAVERAADTDGALVIGSQGAAFSAGANLALLVVDASEGELGEIDRAIRAFQKASMAIKRAPVPVVLAPHGLALGGGCEFVLHAAACVASPETYLGLVETGVGLIPAGGGCKEMALRAARLAERSAAPPITTIVRAFETIATARVSTSAGDARDIGLLGEGAVIVGNDARRLDVARDLALALRTGGWAPRGREGMASPGPDALAAMELSAWVLHEAGRATEHDVRIAKSVARVLSGGGVPAGNWLWEEELMELEREEFLRLVAHPLTLARIAHTLKTGKPLRN